MSRSILARSLALFFAIIAIAIIPWTGYAQVRRFPDVGYSPPAAWSEKKFELSQDYPAQPPSPALMPWSKIDFEKSPREYLLSVLEYCYEGSLEKDFRVQDNSIRKWYHAPWLHWGRNGREFVHGLTRERSSRPFELAPAQAKTYRNYAVGFYNDYGGYTLGQVWKDPDKPSLEAAVFGTNTVSYKLLFTTAPVSEVPFLEGSPEWVADIDRDSSVDAIKGNKVRLLQIDVAVRDDRSDAGGWVFGTFHYDSSVDSESPWKRVRPLALSWGNDPNLTQSMYTSGSRPKQSWIDADSPLVKYRSSPPVGASPPVVLGWGGRANGPVDNPASSCISCHSTAQIPAKSPMIPPEKFSESDKLRWFKNLKVGEPFDASSKSLDFSLQLGVGIQNLLDSQNTLNNNQVPSMSGLQSVFSRSSSRRVESINVPRMLKGQYLFSRDPD